MEGTLHLTARYAAARHQARGRAVLVERGSPAAAIVSVVRTEYAPCACSPLSTRELYTRVSINLLKQVYLATHPGASEKAAELLAELDAEAEEEDV